MCEDEADGLRTPSATGDAGSADALGHPPSASGSVIEAASQPGEDDEFHLIEGYDTNSLASTSATASIYAHTFEHGRRYHFFKNSRYPLPDDDMEQSREDMKHAMMMELTDGKLFYAPIGDHPQQILDIGTGTAGDLYPSAHVRGIDLTPIQPLWVPPNVSFLVDDCTHEWLSINVDLVHFRFMAMILRDVPTVMQHCYKSLKPGGWVEMQELLGEIMCDDNTMPEDDPLNYVYQLADQAFSKFGMDVKLARNLEPILRDAGFVNIQCIAKKVPIGVWAKNKTMRLIGLYQKMAVTDILGAVAGRPFAALGIPPDEGSVIIALARKAMEDNKVHRYFTYYFWYAQKPTDAAEAEGIPSPSSSTSL
ncbi:hypothetical protein SBRCBS47491_008757 [Sporothrix bragantina]|uniref:Methyltransferase domain-containing protein n=1 Tax=Sporothrix bragantina TaxID=671064 RepID=A0ABP0CP27_9PEZI